MLTLEEQLKKAKEVALGAHSGQYRRDGKTPYINHPEAVVAKCTGDTKAKTVAWLHDVLEDTSLTPLDLCDLGFSDNIVEAVDALTKEPGFSYEEYLHGITLSPLAVKVKIYDMLSNLEDDPTPKQVKKYAEGLTYLLMMNVL